MLVMQVGLASKCRQCTLVVVAFYLFDFVNEYQCWIRVGKILARSCDVQARREKGVKCCSSIVRT
jgi:hypothetical protein